MTHDDQSWKGTMTTELERRVRDLREAPLTLDAVRGRANGIRRRRRAAAAGGVLAAAAVVVPVVALGLDGGRQADLGPAGGTTTASDRTSGPADTRPALPQVPYVRDGELVRPDGSTLELPAGAVDAVELDGGRLVVLRQDRDAEQTVEVRDAGRVTESWPTSYGWESDGATVAFTTSAGEVWTVTADAERPQADGYAGWQVTAVDGDDVHLFPQNGEPGPARVLDGDSDVVAGAGYGRVTDAVDGRLAFVDRVSPAGETCGGVVNPDGTVAFRGCDHFVESLAPDGRHSLASPSYHSGAGLPWVAILDATGREVTRYEPVDREGVVGRFAWEDADHVLLLVHDRGAWHTLRMAVDGTRDFVGRSIEGPAEESPYVFSGDF